MPPNAFKGLDLPAGHPWSVLAAHSDLGQITSLLPGAQAGGEQADVRGLGHAVGMGWLTVSVTFLSPTCGPRVTTALPTGTYATPCLDPFFPFFPGPLPYTWTWAKPRENTEHG